MPVLEPPYTSYSRIGITQSQDHSKIAERYTGTALSTTKPLNIFYVWYVELCRRQNTNPICAIRSPNHKNDQVLEFLADRIKIEDWQPVINALRLDTSLHVISIHSRLNTHKVIEEADTEEKVKRIKKWFGAICTKYILKNLLKAIGNCLKFSSVLTCLELDGLQISGEYLLIVLKPLVSNKSLKYLSFKSCPIEDDGCFEVCDALHSLPNVEVINLSSCGLGPKSAEHISKLIKYQQINRYCESWHSSLRYEDPVVSNMAGLRRITLNNNPKIGDEGVEYILNELVDDLWIKAIDMQRCNISEAVAGKIIDTVDYSRSLEVADFRNNNLAPSTIERILELIKGKRNEDEATEYQWCHTTTSIDTNTFGTYISLLNPKVTPKISKNIKNKVTFKRQVSLNQMEQKPSIDQKENKEKSNNLLKPDNSALMKAKEQLMKLYEKLKEETAKRQEAEKKCEELQKQVEQLMHEQKNQMIIKEFANMKQYITKFISLVKEHADIEDHAPIISELQNALEEVHALAKPYESSDKSLLSQSISLKPSAIFRLPAEKNEANDEKLQSLFQSMLGTSEVDSNDECLDLDLSIAGSGQDVVSGDKCDTSRTTESESVETYKRLLDELSQDESSCSDADSFSASASSSDEPRKLKKMVIKIPSVKM